jgi:hypothetical protein
MVAVLDSIDIYFTVVQWENRYLPSDISSLSPISDPYLLTPLQNTIDPCTMYPHPTPTQKNKKKQKPQTASPTVDIFMYG